MDANEKQRLQDTAGSMPENVLTGSFQRASERAGGVQAGVGSGRVLSFPAQDTQTRMENSSFSALILFHAAISELAGMKIMRYRYAEDTTDG